MSFRHPENPGEMVRLCDFPGFEKGVTGYRNGPKLKEDAIAGLKLEQNELGIIVATWSAEAGQSAYCATKWFCIFVPNKGTSWFPLGWLIPADQPAYKHDPSVQSYGGGD